MKHAIFVFFIIILAGVLSGCGGSGGDSSPVVNPEQPPSHVPVEPIELLPIGEWVLTKVEGQCTYHELQMDGEIVTMPADIEEVTLHNSNQLVECNNRSVLLGILNESGIGYDVGVITSVTGNNLAQGFTVRTSRVGVNGEEYAEIIMRGSKIDVNLSNHTNPELSLDCKVNDFTNDQVLYCQNYHGVMVGEFNKESVFELLELMNQDVKQTLITDWVYYIHTNYIEY